MLFAAPNAIAARVAECRAKAMRRDSGLTVVRRVVPV
jgi:hypothetical protein